MVYKVIFAPEAEAQLTALYRYLASEASPDVADHFIGAILDRCERLENFPHRGTPRDDLRPGLRTLSFRRRVTIAYAVDEGQVAILGIFYGGQDIDMILNEEG